MSDTVIPTNKVNKKTSVVYLGHIPPAFEEDEMRKFFTQFGEIKHLKLSRSKKTGGSKHYAFIEFETPDVAEIVASTMNGYILFGRTLVCEVMKAESVHDDIWRGSGKKFRHIDLNKKANNKLNSMKTPEQMKKQLESKNKKNAKKIEEMKKDGLNTAVLEKAAIDYKKALDSLKEEEEKVEVKEVEKKEEVKKVEKKEVAVKKVEKKEVKGVAAKKEVKEVAAMKVEKKEMKEVAAKKEVKEVATKKEVAAKKEVKKEVATKKVEKKEVKEVKEVVAKKVEKKEVATKKVETKSVEKPIVKRLTNKAKKNTK